MKLKTTLPGLVFFVIFLLQLVAPRDVVNAASCTSEYPITVSGAIGGTYKQGDPSNKISFTLNGLESSAEYKIQGSSGTYPSGKQFYVQSFSNSSGTAVFTLDNQEEQFQYSKNPYTLYLSGPGINFWCDLGSYKVIPQYDCGPIEFFTEDDAGKKCYAGENACVEAKTANATLTVTIVDYDGPAANVPILISIGGVPDSETTDADGKASMSLPGLTSGDKTVVVKSVDPDITLCQTKIPVSMQCAEDKCSTDPIILANPAEIVGESPYILCDQINETLVGADGKSLKEQCITCAGGNDENAKDGIWTAIGCIKREPAEIAQTLIRIGLMMGGGVALLMMLVAAFILSVSQGEPKRTEDAKDMITAAFMGLLFVIFSVTILQFIGFTILKIPGFGG